MTFFPGQPIPFEEQSSDNRTVTESTLYFGLVVDISTNLNDGTYKVVIPPGGIKLVENGVVAGENSTQAERNKLLKLYNQKQRQIGNPELSYNNFKKQVEKVGIPEFNQIRADIINENASDFKKRQSTQAKIPGVIDDTTGNVVNTNGEISDGVINPLEFLNTELGLQDPGLSSRKVVRSGIKSSGGILKYPLYDISDFGYDYLYIRRYTVRQGNPENKPGSAFTQIYLPMQPNLEEDNGVNWGADTLNTLQARLVDSAINAMDAAGNADGIGKVLSEIASSLTLDAKNFFSDAAGISDKLKNAAIAYFAGQAVGANIFTRETGSVINPNMELLFNEPQLRTFNFNFSMTPRFEAEANVIRSIIRELKIGMAPKAIEPYFFLYSPDVFELEYRYNGTQHPFMHKFKKRCALTSFSVDYTPSNSYMTYKSNGSMTQYNLSMSFSELEPTYESDQVGGTGT